MPFFIHKLRVGVFVKPESVYTNRIADIAIPVCLVGFGASIYLLFRDTHIFAFRLIAALCLDSMLEQVRLFVRPLNSFFTGFVLYSLPTALWAAAFVYSVLFVWR